MLWNDLKLMKASFMKYSKIHSKRSVKVESHQEATLRRKCSKVIHIKACITHTCKGEMTLNWIWACRAHSIKLNESLSSIKIFLLEVKIHISWFVILSYLSKLLSFHPFLAFLSLLVLVVFSFHLKIKQLSFPAGKNIFFFSIYNWDDASLSL